MDTESYVTLIGVGLILAGVGHHLSWKHRLRGWAKTQGLVTGSYAAESEAEGPYVKYRYQVDGGEFEGVSYHATDVTLGAGAKIDVYYRPESPDESRWLDPIFTGMFSWLVPAVGVIVVILATSVRAG